MRTRVKICGITRPEDLQAAVSAGADAIGLNMYAKSQRHVDLTLAASLAGMTPPLVSVVGLFVDPDADAVRAACSKVPFDLLQFHGDESNAFCASFGRRFIKAIRVEPEMDLASAVARYPDSSGVLLDAWVQDAYGGTGVQLDWSVLPALATPIVLAGGLNPGNVGAAIRVTRPWGVDVSTGVEISPGRKDAGKIEAFIAAVAAADEETR